MNSNSQSSMLQQAGVKATGSNTSGQSDLKAIQDKMRYLQHGNLGGFEKENPFRDLKTDIQRWALEAKFDPKIRVFAGC